MFMGEVHEVLYEVTGLNMYMWWDEGKLYYSWCNPIWFQ